MRKLLVSIAAVTLAAGACAVHDTDTPALTGPSANAITLSVTATPDTIPQNGTAQASIAIRAFNAGGQPYPKLTVRLDMQVGSDTQDFGTITPRTLVTDASGNAFATYTAPSGPGVGGVGSTVAIVATPVASDAANTGILNSVGALFQAYLHLTPATDIVPPHVEIPVASFTLTPDPPLAGGVTLLNASGSCAGTVSGSACASTSRTITSYTWDFGDGTTGSGQIVSHQFPKAGPVAIKLTVTNDTNASNTATLIKTVAAPSATSPTAAFLMLPNPSSSGVAVSFDASVSSPSTDGVAIVNYFWNFGDGSNRVGGSSPTTSHTFNTGVTTSFTVTLTVTDAKGRTATVSHDITVNP